MKKTKNNQRTTNSRSFNKGSKHKSNRNNNSPITIVYDGEYSGYRSMGEARSLGERICFCC